MGWKLPGSPQFLLLLEPLTPPGLPQRREGGLSTRLLSHSLSSDFHRQSPQLLLWALHQALL